MFTTVTTKEPWRFYSQRGCFRCGSRNRPAQVGVPSLCSLSIRPSAPLQLLLRRGAGHPNLQRAHWCRGCLLGRGKHNLCHMRGVGWGAVQFFSSKRCAFCCRWGLLFANLFHQTFVSAVMLPNERRFPLSRSCTTITWEDGWRGRF